MDLKKRMKKGLKSLHREGHEFLKKKLDEESERRKTYNREYNKAMKKALKVKAKADVEARVSKKNIWDSDERFYKGPEVERKEKKIW